MQHAVYFGGDLRLIAMDAALRTVAEADAIRVVEGVRHLISPRTITSYKHSTAQQKRVQAQVLQHFRVPEALAGVEQRRGDIVHAVHARNRWRRD